MCGGEEGNPKQLLHAIKLKEILEWLHNRRRGYVKWSN